MQILAPGKLFLVGEYAALDGCPCAVAAVDRGVRCRVLPGRGIETPGGDDRFVRAALRAVSAPPRCYRFSDWNPVALPDKPGFGGSAAATVAAVLAGALAGAAERPGAADLEAAAVRAHRAVQGSGSGLDVRASFRGGLRRYDPAAAGVPDTPLPALPLLAVYSGRSASTGARLRRYRALGAAERAAFLRRSRELVDHFAERPLEVLAEGYALLRAMAAAAELPYDTPALGRIAELAAAHGGAAKPSGAGGGDVAVALIPDGEARAAFAAACRSEGLPPIPVTLSPGAWQLAALGERHG